jgi:large subunit ribosomal protein L7/L12
MLAVLELWDYVGLGLMGLLIATIAWSNYDRFRSRDRLLLRRIESKLDLILGKLGIPVPDPGATSGLSPAVRELLTNESRKIEAIKLHREETGVGLKEAKDAVEAYLADNAK